MSSRQILCSNSSYIWLRNEKKSMLLFSPTGLDGKFSYAFKLSLEKGVSRKEFNKSYVEEAIGAGRPRGGALVGGGLSRGGVRASTLDSSSKARAGMGLFSMSCQGSGRAFC